MVKVIKLWPTSARAPLTVIIRRRLLVLLSRVGAPAPEGRSASRPGCCLDLRRDGAGGAVGGVVNTRIVRGADPPTTPPAGSSPWPSSHPVGERAKPPGCRWSTPRPNDLHPGGLVCLASPGTSAEGVTRLPPQRSQTFRCVRVGHPRAGAPPPEALGQPFVTWGAGLPSDGRRPPVGHP